MSLNQVNEWEFVEEVETWEVVEKKVVEEVEAWEVVEKEVVEEVEAWEVVEDVEQNKVLDVLGVDDYEIVEKQSIIITLVIMQLFNMVLAGMITFILIVSNINTFVTLWKVYNFVSEISIFFNVLIFVISLSVFFAIIVYTTKIIKTNINTKISNVCKIVSPSAIVKKLCLFFYRKD